MSCDPDVFGIGENQVGEQGVLVPVALREAEMLKERAPVEFSPCVTVERVGVGYLVVGLVAVHDRLPVIIHVIRAALHQIAVVGKGGVQHGVDGTGQEKIVGINEHEVFAQNLPDAGISRAGKALVPLVNDRHPGVVGVGVRNRGGGVGRAVVHQNDAVCILCLLRQHGVHALGKIGFHVIGRDHDLQIALRIQQTVVGGRGSRGGRGEAQQRFPCAGRIHGGSPAENRRGCVQDAFQGAFDRTFQRRCCHSITSKNSILFPGWKVNIPASG